MLGHGAEEAQLVLALRLLAPALGLEPLLFELLVEEHAPLLQRRQTLRAARLSSVDYHTIVQYRNNNNNNNNNINNINNGNKDLSGDDLVDEDVEGARRRRRRTGRAAPVPASTVAAAAAATDAADAAARTRLSQRRRPRGLNAVEKKNKSKTWELKNWNIWENFYLGRAAAFSVGRRAVADRRRGEKVLRSMMETGAEVVRPVRHEKSKKKTGHIRSRRFGDLSVRKTR